MEAEAALPPAGSDITDSPRRQVAGSGGGVNGAATKLQKVYRSYRTRRNLADSAVVIEELWWQILDFTRLNHTTISFFSEARPNTATSHWHRVSLNASKVGQGLSTLSTDGKALKLAFEHWIEAIDARHRSGHNLHFYYNVWCESQVGQPFFYWLDVGDGKDVDLPKCPRTQLKKQCIKYLGPQERKLYEYKQSGKPLDTSQGPEEAKWIFVMSTRRLYAGKSIWAYSGHYKPSVENLKIFMKVLEENGVDLKKVAVRPFTAEDYYDDPVPNDTKNLTTDINTPQVILPLNTTEGDEDENAAVEQAKPTYQRTLSGGLRSPKAIDVPQKAILERIKSKSESESYQLGHKLPMKWSTGAGPRIGCVKDYPVELRMQAMEIVDL